MAIPNSSADCALGWPKILPSDAVFICKSESEMLIVNFRAWGGSFKVVGMN